MSMEVGVLVDINGDPIHWHRPPGSSGASLPDSRDLWDVIWENRADVLGFAHSHPGGGEPGPSHTDITTFRAVEKALGRRLIWWITSSTHLVVCQWRRRSRKEPGTWVPELVNEYESWQSERGLEELRRLSYGGGV